MFWKRFSEGRQISARITTSDSRVQNQNTACPKRRENQNAARPVQWKSRSQATYARLPALSTSFNLRRGSPPLLTRQVIWDFFFSVILINFAPRREPGIQDGSTPACSAKISASKVARARLGRTELRAAACCGLEKFALMPKRCSILYIPLRARLVRRCLCCPFASASAPCSYRIGTTSATAEYCSSARRCGQRLADVNLHAKG